MSGVSSSVAASLALMSNVLGAGASPSAVVGSDSFGCMALCQTGGGASFSGSISSFSDPSSSSEIMDGFTSTSFSVSGLLSYSGSSVPAHLQYWWYLSYPLARLNVATLLPYDSIGIVRRDFLLFQKRTTSVPVVVSPAPPRLSTLLRVCAQCYGLSSRTPPSGT